MLKKSSDLRNSKMTKDWKLNMLSKISTELHPQSTHTKISKNVYSFSFKGVESYPNVYVLKYMSLFCLLFPVYALVRLDCFCKIEVSIF